MVEAKDLRIGNLLKRLDDSVFVVSSADIIRIEELPGSLRPKPIELTEEWLIDKMSFEDKEYEGTLITKSQPITSATTQVDLLILLIGMQAYLYLAFFSLLQP